MNMQDQTRKAFGHYASRQTARAKTGSLAKAIVDSDLKAGSRLNPLFMKQGDDLESPLYVTPNSSAMDYDGDSLPDEKSYSRLVKRSRSYEAGTRTDDYVQPPKVEDMSFTDALVGHLDDNLTIDVSGHGSSDVIIARSDVAKELGSTFVNGFGDVAKVVSSDDFSISDDIGIGYDYDGDSFPDEKGYSRLAKRGYSARNMTDDYIQPPKADDYVQPPKAEDYVQPPKDMSFIDALVNQNNDNLYKDVAGHNASDTIVASPEVAKEMGSVFVDDFGNFGKVVTKDQVGKQARDYTAGNLTDDYVQPPKYDDYVQPPKADDYVHPPKADDYVQPLTAPDAFDASQFEMAADEATIDDVPMGIDEGQFDMGLSKGLQQ